MVFNGNLVRLGASSARRRTRDERRQPSRAAGSASRTRSSRGRSAAASRRRGSPRPSRTSAASARTARTCCAPDAIGARRARAPRATRAPFALNLWVSDHDPGGRRADARRRSSAPGACSSPTSASSGVDRSPSRRRASTRAFDEQVEALLEARPPVFSFVFGIPVRARCWPSAGGAASSRSAPRPSIAEARALDEAGVDVDRRDRLRGRRPSSVVPRARRGLAHRHVRARAARRAARARSGDRRRRHRRPARRARRARARRQARADRHRVPRLRRSPARRDAHRALLPRRARAAHRADARVHRPARARRCAIAGPTRSVRVSSELPPFPIQAGSSSQLQGRRAAAGRTDLVSLWSGQIAPNLRHRTAADAHGRR